MTATNIYARAAIIWAFGGGILFIPCAMLLVLLAWLGGDGWLLPILAVLAIVLTYAGMYLYATGGAALMQGKPDWQLRLTLAPWFVWNVLLGLSMGHAGQIALAAFSPSTPSPPYGAYLDICVALHLVANLIFIAAYRYVRTPMLRAPAR